MTFVGLISKIQSVKVGKKLIFSKRNDDNKAIGIRCGNRCANNIQI